MPFQKGNPGGPGRPKQKPFLEWCGKWTVERAEKFLIPIAEKSSSKNQLEAIKLIMAYGVGKPVETQILDAEITASLGSSTEDLAREAAELIGDPKIGSVEAPGENKVGPGK